MRKTWALTENGRLRSHPEKGFVQGATKKLKSFFFFFEEWMSSTSLSELPQADLRGLQNMSRRAPCARVWRPLSTWGSVYFSTNQGAWVAQSV